MTTTAQRLAAHSRWRWMPGACDAKGWRVTEVAPDGVYACVVYGMEVDWERVADMGPPDLSDRATIGCLVGMLREAVDEGCLVQPWFAAEAIEQIGPSAEIVCQHVDASGPYMQARAAGVVAAFVKATIDGDGEAVALALLAAWGET